jgi:uncharacterized membrane protein YphA (DoxX/SURF4 family)
MGYKKMKKYMNWEQTKRLVGLVCRIVLGFVFIYAGIGKIVEPNVFAKEIMNYRLLPEIIAKTIAIILPWLELSIGFLLLFGVKTRTASILSSGLLIIFTMGVLSAMIRGLNINCGCFSQHIEYVGWKKVAENLALILTSIYLAISPTSYFSFDNRIAIGNAEHHQSNQ